MSNEMYNTVARVTDGIYEGEFWQMLNNLLMRYETKDFVLWDVVVNRYCYWWRRVPWIHFV